MDDSIIPPYGASPQIQLGISQLIELIDAHGRKYRGDLPKDDRTTEPSEPRSITDAKIILQRLRAASHDNGTAGWQLVRDMAAVPHK